MLAEIAREHNAELVRERLKDLKNNNKKRSKQLNYRLSTFPYRKFVEYTDCKFQERGLSLVEVNAKKTSIICPICGHADRKNSKGKHSNAGIVDSNLTPSMSHA